MKGPVMLSKLFVPLVVAAGASLAEAQPVGGAGFDPASAVAAIVKVPKPWYAPRALVISRMRETLAQYDALPGLVFKAYSLAQADGHYGGVYLWKDLSAARAHFSPAWFERVEKERGSKGEVRFFEVPVAIDNVAGGTARSIDSAAVATLVTIAVPAGATRARLVQEFQASMPVYRAVNGLWRKYFVLTDDGRFGGIYLWQDEASAKAWFNDAWKERVRKSHGSEAAIEWFDTPILLPSKLADHKPVRPGP
jgi:heme-degrading monooxygenase HmoA